MLSTQTKTQTMESLEIKSVVEMQIIMEMRQHFTDEDSIKIFNSLCLSQTHFPNISLEELWKKEKLFYLIHKESSIQCIRMGLNISGLFREDIFQSFEKIKKSILSSKNTEHLKSCKELLVLFNDKFSSHKAISTFNLELDFLWNTTYYNL